MRRRDFHLVQTACRRCGKPIMTGSRSLVGADDLKAQLGEICGQCITPEEEAMILEGQAQAILRTAQQ